MVQPSVIVPYVVQSYRGLGKKGRALGACLIDKRLYRLENHCSASGMSVQNHFLEKIMTMQTLHLIPRAGVGPSLSPAQKTFNRLITKIKKLQQEQKDATQELDAALQFYYGKILPEEALLQKALAERIKIAYQQYKTSKDFTKEEIRDLKKLVVEDIGILCAMADASAISDEIKDIFKEVNGVSYEEDSAEAMESMKHEVQKKFRASGVEVDFSDLNINDPREKIVHDMFRSIGKAFSNHKNTDKKTSKTKKQQEKELKRQAFEEMQKRSLNTIYKQLARALHPDLEQDCEQRQWKEGIMKKLTSAYKKGDLCELLIIEMELLSRSNDALEFQHNEQLEIYNSILKDQEKDLQAAIAMLPMHPKYMPLQEFDQCPFGIVVGLRLKYDELKQDVQVLHNHVVALQTKNTQKLLRAAIKERKAMDF
jgi:uncharacterized protein (UPF0335 family)